ncbi:MAG: polyketide cyclase / dehydrase and lipid transport [Micromonosporaceae bacterium]|nr:polyketide cyclase / dehydrase and lipid transport [Micromonosporaceae bacterium]
MPQIDLVEETFVAAAPEAVRGRLATLEFARRLWPDLRLRVTQDRGAKGLRHAVSGDFTGTAEVWLEDWADGVIVHVYLRVDPTGAAWSPRRALRELHRRQRALKSVLWAVKDEHEGGRRPGEPARR